MTCKQETASAKSVFDLNHCKYEDTEWAKNSEFQKPVRLLQSTSVLKHISVLKFHWKIKQTSFPSFILINFIIYYRFVLLSQTTNDAIQKKYYLQQSG